MAVPANRVPVRVARGLKSALQANVSELQEGEVVYAKDENSLYVVESGSLTSVTPDLANSSVDELSDVDTSTVSPTDGQLLGWHSASSKWKPVDAGVQSDVAQGGTGSGIIDNIVQISQANYDALGTKDSTTLYVIV